MEHLESVPGQRCTASSMSGGRRPPSARQVVGVAPADGRPPPPLSVSMIKTAASFTQRRNPLTDPVTIAGLKPITVTASLPETPVCVCVCRGSG